MKTLEGSWPTDLAADLSTICVCFKITRTDGESFFFTDHDTNIVVDGDTYLANTGVSVSTLKQEGNFTVDNLDITGFFEAGVVTKADILAGRWDYAEVDVYFVNWEDYQSLQVD